MNMMRNILNLGAGVQSTTVLLMSIRGELPKLDYAIFADTGWEPPAVYDHLSWCEEQAENAGIVMARVQSSNLKEDALRSQVFGRKTDGVRWASLPFFTRKIWGRHDIPLLKKLIAEFELGSSATLCDGDLFGYDEPPTKLATKYRKVLREVKVRGGYIQDGMIRRQCTKEYKIQPIEKWIKKYVLELDTNARFPTEPIVMQWFGISSDEITRTRTPDKPWRTFFYPLCGCISNVDGFIFDQRAKTYTRQQCLNWISRNGYREPPRSACIGCPFHSDSEWRAMKLSRPEEFDDACLFDEAIRDCGGMRGQCFLHSSRIPLREVDLRNDADLGQLNMFENECAGMCGV